eukprot:594324-Rhodomonas_salina.1
MTVSLSKFILLKSLSHFSVENEISGGIRASESEPVSYHLNLFGVRPRPAWPHPIFHYSVVHARGPPSRPIHSGLQGAAINCSTVLSIPET